MLLTPILPTKERGQVKWSGLTGCAKSLIVSELAKKNESFIFVLTHDILEAEILTQEISFFAPNINIINFPDWETLPYDQLSPHHDITSERLATLSKLITIENGILIVPLTTTLTYLAPKEYIQKHSFNFKIKDTVKLENFKKNLLECGYRIKEQVLEHGEFAIRGSIIDLFPMGSQTPYRIEFFDNEIETIRSFDPESQRSDKKITEIKLLPAHEIPFDRDAQIIFLQNFQEIFNQNPHKSIICQEIKKQNLIPGIEYYIPLFFRNTETIFDYIPKKSTIISTCDIFTLIEGFLQKVKQRFDDRCHDITHPILSPEKVFLTKNLLAEKLKQFNQVKILSSNTTESAHKINFETEKLPDFNIKKKLITATLNKLTTQNTKILFCAESHGRQEIFLDFLNTINIKPNIYTAWGEFVLTKNIYNIIVAPIFDGTILKKENVIIITENELLGFKPKQRNIKKLKNKDYDYNAVIKNLTELKIGDPIVHIEHGVGRFNGLKIITTGNITDEYLVITYADNANLYVPISFLELISRYSGSNLENAPLHKLGTNTWEKEKQKAENKIYDVAVEILELQAQRHNRKGFAFKIDEIEYQKFITLFPFEETIDQQKAIYQVLEDMQSEKPMDRLICGDVGFGKTEVAMRAAFVAIQNNKQVAILVPTTLLAQQHFQTFSDRFANFAVKIDLLSRFRTTAEQKKIITNLALGKVDIIIGTHKLLQNDINFKELGLLIIDEEHRFGVRQKEIIKKIRTEVDILTLTATPIPRTLNMALSGLRDISIIASPPSKRLAIKTFVQKYNKNIIYDAITREISRGGQVYFLHNNVDTIIKIRDFLIELIPQAKINYAHGQLREHELEKTMIDFYHRRFNVLVCTTIIETGIDIPSANTIIINDADHFGLAQLHQLRGRVGRSHHQAYAYLLIPEYKNLTHIAKKRLDAISDAEDLGIGFTLATQDMEIRGSGELLGEEQSGSIDEIGFNLYMQMLEKTIHTLKKNKNNISSIKPFDIQLLDINLNVSAIIPDNFINDAHMRLILYKRISSTEQIVELNNLKSEMIDRFGSLPDSINNLFKIRALKIKITPLSINKITANDINITIVFMQNASINTQKIISLLQSAPKQHKLINQFTLQFFVATKNIDERILAIETMLQKITI